jgi:large subunit ribosomal protein L16
LLVFTKTTSFNKSKPYKKKTVIGYPDSNKLKNVPKTPTPHANTSLLTMTKRLADIRGPELVHNKLIHKQYGIVALSGGNLTIGHFEMLRNTINRFMDLTKAFAVYRVDPPWKPVTRHGQGKKLGGGKGGIEFYVTPVKRGRVIVEIGGLQTREMLTRVMVDLAQKMPFPAKFVSQADLEAWDAEELFIKQNNINKLRWEWCMKNNIMNVIQYSGKYDIDFSEFGPDCR